LRVCIKTISKVHKKEEGERREVVLIRDRRRGLPREEFVLRPSIAQVVAFLNLVIPLARLTRNGIWTGLSSWGTEVHHSHRIQSDHGFVSMRVGGATSKEVKEDFTAMLLSQARENTITRSKKIVSQHDDALRHQWW
jgi:hypothetical protein